MTADLFGVLFPIAAGGCPRPAGPIRRQHAVAHIPMKTGIRPRDNLIHPTMLDRIEMDVIDMPLQVFVVPYLMFPETSLPDSAFAFALFARAAAGIGMQGLGESRLDPLPAARIIGISRRQAPDCMNMIGKHADSQGFERHDPYNLAIGGAERIDVTGQQRRAPVSEIDRKEKGAARDKRASVSGHTAW